MCGFNSIIFFLFLKYCEIYFNFLHKTYFTISDIYIFASIKDKVLATGSVVVKDSLNQLDVKKREKKSAIKVI